MKTSTQPVSYKEIFKDPLILIHFFLRIALVIFVIYKKHWMSGDTPGYLSAAEDVVKGAWGGDTSKVPLYLWFLAIFSFGKIHRGLSPPLDTMGIALPLILQTLVVFFCGLMIYRKFGKSTGRKIALLWLFDPMVFAYSNFVMTDVFFSVAVLLVALSFYEICTQPITTPRILKFTLATAFMIYIRNPGFQIFWMICGALAFLLFKKKIKIKSLLLYFIVLFSLLLPRLYWVHAKTGQTQLFSQGGGWIHTVVAAVVYRDQGIGFFDAEVKWENEHHEASMTSAFKILFSQFPAWMYLSTKGALRVLFGHNIVDWCGIATGEVCTGPAWFKTQEKTAINFVPTSLYPLWGLGVFLSALFYLWIYTQTIKFILLTKNYLNPYYIWGCMTVLMLAFLTMVYGDARFRAPVIPIVFILWATAEFQLKNQKK